MVSEKKKNFLYAFFYGFHVKTMLCGNSHFKFKIGNTILKVWHRSTLVLFKNALVKIRETVSVNKLFLCIYNRVVLWWQPSWNSPITDQFVIGSTWWYHLSKMCFKRVILFSKIIFVFFRVLCWSNFSTVVAIFHFLLLLKPQNRRQLSLRSSSISDQHQIITTLVEWVKEWLLLANE